MAKQVCKWCRQAIMYQGDWRSITPDGTRGSYCPTTSGVHEPASPSAAGEPPKCSNPNCEGGYVYAANGMPHECNVCKPERGNQPQEPSSLTKCVKEGPDCDCKYVCKFDKAPGVGSEPLTHTRSCSQLNPMSDDSCTCGLEWRIALQTEQTMHNAWRKRAEEDEIEIADLRRQLEQAKQLSTANVEAVREFWKKRAEKMVKLKNDQLAAQEIKLQAAEQKLAALGDADYILNVDATWKAKNAEIAELKAKLAAHQVGVEHVANEIVEAIGPAFTVGLEIKATLDDFKKAIYPSIRAVLRLRGVAAALPSEEAIAVLAQKEVGQLLFDCRSSAGTSPKTFSESQLYAALIGFARAVRELLKGDSHEGK